MMCPRCGSESVQENAAACDDSSLSCKICEKCGHRWQGSDWFGCLFEEKTEEQKRDSDKPRKSQRR
ncbi:hypothetical protein [Halarsenatibacter silvermanii]|uniref:Uncharacterized protein n=1 Tax=Halarsenatibacter silvermanii TaxID=321763 RepID=A0A1G9MTJ2_9FIRM|nr:hypothetical protein [Halarsenatibacter silvermanii]SDL77626.1 hypothetical protein SAMN04488692_1099 [Halarsenatibacter silvermanii]